MTNPAVLVWVKTETTCVQCDATRRALKKAGIDFIERALEDHPDTVEDFKKRGLLQAPIVETDIPDIGTFSGFRPDLIKALQGARND